VKEIRAPNICKPAQTSLEREASVITYWFHRIRKRRLEPCGTR